MRTFLFTVALLLSSAASAQVQLTFTNNQKDTLRFGKSGCTGANVSVTWTKTLSPCRPLSLWLSARTTCGTAATDGDISLPDVPQTTFAATQTGTFTFSLSSLPFATTDGGGCGTQAVDQTFLVCGSTSQQEFVGCSSTVIAATAAKVVYDGKPPAAPTFATVAGLDSAASVTLASPSDATFEELVVLRGDEEVRRVRQAVGKGAIVVGGLENNVTYQLQAYATDEAENVSEASTIAEVTPTKTFGFLDQYKEAGGQETGGCGAVGGGVVGGAVLAVLGFWLSSRRNRSWREQ